MAVLPASGSRRRAAADTPGPADPAGPDMAGRAGLAGGRTGWAGRARCRWAAPVVPPVLVAWPRNRQTVVSIRSASTRATSSACAVPVRCGPGWTSEDPALSPVPDKLLVDHRRAGAFRPTSSQLVGRVINHGPDPGALRP